MAAYGGASSIGPTTDNKRSKPDLTAPADATSDSTPLVAGAAAILLQAGLRGDGGSDTNSAADARTLKALLLNGAIKPADWTNGSAVPLDQRYGAGILNVFESYKQLAGGKHAFIATSSVAVGAAHPPTGSTNNLSSLFGWDLDTATSSSTNDAVNHYYFNLPGGNSNGAFTATATLVWNRQQNKTAINEVDLYLYGTAATNLLARSSNSIDNVKQIFIPQLAPGRYDLQVLKKGGSGANFVSASITYALAFEFFNVTLGTAHLRRQRRSDVARLSGWLHAGIHPQSQPAGDLDRGQHHARRRQQPEFRHHQRQPRQSILPTRPTVVSGS